MRRSGEPHPFVSKSNLKSLPHDHQGMHGSAIGTDNLVNWVVAAVAAERKARWPFALRRYSFPTIN